MGAAKLDESGGKKNITAEVLMNMGTNNDDTISLREKFGSPVKPVVKKQPDVMGEVDIVTTDGPVDALPQRAKKQKPKAPANDAPAANGNGNGNGHAAAHANGNGNGHAATANGHGDANGNGAVPKSNKNGGIKKQPSSDAANDDASAAPAVKNTNNNNSKNTNNNNSKSKSGGNANTNGKPAAAAKGANGSNGRPEIPERPELEELPKRQLWIVRVPKPAEDENSPEDIAAMEEQVTELTAKVDKAVSVISAKQEERNAARGNLTTVRERMREVANDIREKFTQAKPLQDRVNAINATQTEVKDMSRELKVTTEDALDATLEDLEYKMSHESLSVLQQKAILRQGTRTDIQDLHEKRAAVADAKWEKDECYAQLKLVRGEIDILKQQEAVQKKIFDHFKGVADAADAEVKKANERRVESVKERGRISAELRAMRNTGNRDKSEFWRARRTVGKARELAKKGNIAEAEALCLEQMEHMHARLNMDDGYRAEYLEAMVKMNEERAAAREKAKEEAQKEVEEAAKIARARIAEEEKLRKEEERLLKLAAKEAEKDAKVREKEADKAAAAALKLKQAEDKRKAEEAAEAKKAALAKKRAEIQANAQGRKPSAMPDLGPSKVAAAWAEADALAHGHHTPEAIAAHVASQAARAVQDKLLNTETEEQREKREARERAMAGTRVAEEKKKRMAERKAQRAENAKKALAAEEAKAAAHAKKEEERVAAEANSRRRARAADAALVAANDGAALVASDALAKRKMPAAMAKKDKHSKKKWYHDEQVGILAVGVSVILMFLMCLAAMLNGKI